MTHPIRYRKSILRLFKLCMLSFFLACFFACESPPANEQSEKTNTSHEQELQQVYTNFKTAVVNGNGTEASKLISANTIRYYDSLLDLVLNADSSKLVLAGLLEKFTVLAIRHTVDWGRLRAMDGKQLFIYAIENGMIGKDLSNYDVGRIEMKNENLATAELLIKGKQTQKNTNFYRENGRWRLDMLEMLNENSKSLKQMMGQPSSDENICMMLFFEKVFGQKPGYQLWLPVKIYSK